MKRTVFLFLIANNLYSGELNIRESQSFGDFAIYYAGIVGLSNSVKVKSMRHNMFTDKITLDLKGSQTAQAFGGITGNLSFKDVIQTHIFMGEAYISGNFNITDYLGSEDVLGSQYVYNQSKSYKIKRF